MNERLQKALVTVIAAIIQTLIWLATIGYSAWLEWHGQHDHAAWILLLCITLSLAWLKCIEKNTDRIPRNPNA